MRPRASGPRARAGAPGPYFVVSVADRLCFGLVADPAVAGDPDLLAGAVELEATELLRAGEGLDVEPPGRPAVNTGPGH